MRECPKCELCFNEDVLFCPHDSADTRSMLPGTTLLAGRYLLEKRIGRGAMGQVYLARDENLGTRKVAVKTVRQDFLNSESLQEGEAIARFEREARSAASIRHPNVVDVTDFGKTDDGVFYLVMEYVEGETLHRLLRREGTLTTKRALHLLKQIAAGVEAAHEAGILHRDLKPANIFLMYTKKNREESSDDDGFVKVGDFGLAKIVNQTATDTNSENGPASRGIVGTPEFMAPEQMQHDAQLDTRADIYALGSIAYLMLGGKTPFTGDLPQLVAQKLMDKPALLSATRSDIPFEVEDVVMQALETDPAARPASVSAWLADFEKAVNSSSEKPDGGMARLVIMGPAGAEVYVDDERRGSIGNSGRLVLTTIPAGQHILRVCLTGSRDDERVIEVREGASEQVIQANLHRLGTPSSPSSSLGSGTAGYPSSLPDIVSCTKCGARFASGVKFCGRCGGTGFVTISQPSISGTTSVVCPRCSLKMPLLSKFCGRCGFRITAGTLQMQSSVHQAPRRVEIFCGKCRTGYPAGTKFCGRCGITLN